MRRTCIPTYRNARRLTAMLVALCLTACGNETLVDDPGTGGENGSGTAGGEITVVIAAPQTETRAIDEETGDRIRSVRIYAYEHGKTDEAPVGYLEDNHFITGVGTYKMEIEKRGQLDFIALLNDGGVEQANGQNIILNESSTRADLEKFRIGRQLTTISDEYAIPMSTLEGENGANRTFTLTETTAPQYVNLMATRALSRLRLYFAKADMGDGVEVQITEATLTQGPLSVQLMKEEDRESLTYPGTYFDNDNATDITVVPQGSPVEVTEEIDDPDRTKLTSTNTTLVATAYMPENPYGSNNTHDDGLYDDQYDGTGTANSPYKLTVRYQAGTGTSNKEIYLPAVKRNQTVNIFGLLRGEEVKFYVRVADWETVDVTLDDYPTYSDCELAENRTGYITTAQYVTVDAPDNVTSAELTTQKAAAFACTFNMTAPDGHVFTPVLTGAGEGRFKLYIENSSHYEVTECKAGEGAYTIYVIPTAPYDADNEALNTVYLLITTRTWAGAADPLLINQKHQWNEGNHPQDDRILITLIPSDGTGDDEGEDGGETNT